ncbi:Inner membrane transport protein YdhC [Pseudomonas sp. MM227]|uniref:MFS transporter n=1 Tax=Pseudomonas sp. MM227 TaxID=3019968 RepID=UPI00222013E1|nr:MFS transporter [Pseudomonas sp. MM227]CAI3786608.1 Inner membrane transport protein YdhC [Pseudomonas sp. MM227]
MNCDLKRTDQRQAGIIALLILMTSLGVFPLDVILPSFPALAEHFQTSTTRIAFSLSIFAMGFAFSQIAIGPLSDRFGRKKLLLAGLGLAVSGAIGCTMAQDFSSFLAFRLVQAIGCGCFVLANAIIQDLFFGTQRRQLRILMVSISGICISVSPLIGTMLQTVAGWTASFHVFAALGVVTIWLARKLMDQDSISSSSINVGWSDRFGPCMKLRFIGMSLLSAIAFASHFSFIVISPLFFLEKLGFTSMEFAFSLLCYSLAYVGGGYAASRLGRVTSVHVQMTAGLTLILGSGTAIILMPETWQLSFASILVPAIFCTAGASILRPAATSEALDLSEQSAGTASSLLNTTVFIIGGVVSAFVSNSSHQLLQTLGWTFVLMGASGVLLLNALAFLARRAPPSSL